jgi:hypothetical protein
MSATPTSPRFTPIKRLQVRRLNAVVVTEIESPSLHVRTIGFKGMKKVETHLLRELSWTGSRQSLQRLLQSLRAENQKKDWHFKLNHGRPHLPLVIKDTALSASGQT